MTIPPRTDLDAMGQPISARYTYLSSPLGMVPVNSKGVRFLIDRLALANDIIKGLQQELGLTLPVAA